MQGVLGTLELSSLGILCVKGQKIVHSVLQQRNDPRSGPRISRRFIDGLNILITMTLYKLACPLSRAEFCFRDQIHSQMQPRVHTKGTYRGYMLRVHGL